MTHKPDGFGILRSMLQRPYPSFRSVLEFIRNNLPSQEVEREWIPYALEHMKRWSDHNRSYTPTQEGFLDELGASISLVRSVSFQHLRGLPGEKLHAIAHDPRLSPVPGLEFFAMGLVAEDLDAIHGGGWPQTVRRLSFARNFELRNDGAIKLAGMLDLAALESLDLTSTNLGSKGLERLLENESVQSLEELSLSDNQLTAGAMKHIEKTRELDNLEKLSLGGASRGRNKIMTAGMLTLCSCEHLSSLKSLGLNKAWIEDEGAEALANSPTFSNLTYLTLSDNNLTSSGVDALFASPTLEKLEWLGLGQNDCGGVSFRNLVTSGAMARLRHLDMRACNLTDDVIEALLDAPFLETLEALFLCDNPLTDRAAELLANASFGSLRHLDLSRTLLTQKAREDLDGRWERLSANGIYKG